MPGKKEKKAQEDDWGTLEYAGLLIMNLLLVYLLLYIIRETFFWPF